MLYLNQISNGKPASSSLSQMDTSNNSRPPSGSVRPSSAAASSSAPSRVDPSTVKEDDVDQFLTKMDGRIPRPRSEQLYVFLVLYTYSAYDKVNF